MQGTVPSAGVLDLRHLDLDQGETVLHAGWQLHWQQLLEPSDFASGRVGPSIPAGTGKWSRYTWQGRKLPDTGCGTYRLALLVDTARVHSLAFSAREVGSAYRLWVDGTLLMENGVPAAVRDRERPQSTYALGEVPVRSPRVELVLQTSNFHNQFGGIGYTVRCGSLRHLRGDLLNAVIFQSMFLGIFLLIAVLWSATWIAHREERGFLWFALFCFAWAVIQLGDSGSEMRLATLLWSDFPFELGGRLVDAAYGLMFPLWYLFLYRQHPYRVVRWCIAVAGVLSLLNLLAAAFLTMDRMDAILRLSFLVTLLMRPISAGVLIHAAWRRRPGAALLLAGQLGFTGATLCDILSAIQVIHLPYMSSFGVMTLILAMALSLARRTATTHRSNEGLLEQLQSRNQELERLSRVKDDFLANTSHELRTPLHGIMGIAEVGLSLPGEQQSVEAPEHFRIIRSSARRLARLVDDLLDVSRLRQADLVLHPVPTAVAPLVQQVAEHFRSAVDLKGIALVQQLDPKALVVQADPDRLEQILFNLVGNAVKFTVAGSITIVALQEGDEVRFEVRDTGSGIAVADQERVFEAFEQGKGVHGGTGLGLAISRHLVELHGARLELRSREGEGTTFAFRLPQAAGAVASEEPSRKVIPADPDEPVVAFPESPKEGAVTVLAVDDEPLNLRILRSHLQARGFRVVCLESGEGIEEVVEREAPALVLLDVMMPGEDGFSVCRRLRGRWGVSELPVLFVTARTRMEDLELGFGAGGNDYLVKPFLRQELLARVELHVRQKQDADRRESPAGQISRVMRLALALWEKSTGKVAVDLAQASDLWTVQVDGNGWRRAQTLEKYLDASKVPRNPRWKTVEATVRYVLEEAGSPAGPEVAALKEWLATRV